MEPTTAKSSESALEAVGGARAPRRGGVFDALGAWLPGALGERYATALRDARFVRARLRGEGPAPYSLRTGAAYASAPPPAARALAARAGVRVRVARIDRRTRGSVLVWLEPAGEGAALPAARAGQFVTLAVTIDGVEHRRAYSVCSDAGEGPGFALGVKRVEGGLVSGYLCERLREGDVLRALGPSGTFVLEPGRAGAGPVLVAGGSGVTPLYAMARAALREDPAATVRFVYGARQPDEALLRDELEALAREHPGRFALRLVFEEGAGSIPGAREGRLDAATLGALCDELGAGPAHGYFLCGPAAMMQGARALLEARGVPRERVFEERFATLGSVASARGEGGATRERVSLTVRPRGGYPRVVPVTSEQTLLEAGLAAGLAMPFSCTLGGCGACRVKLAAGSGEVAHDEPNCLTERERAEGYALACCARPRGAVAVELP